MNVSLIYQFCSGVYCVECDEDFEVLELQWATEDRSGHWPPVAADGGHDHHFEGGNRFSIEVQLKYLLGELKLGATVELLPGGVNPYAEGVLRLCKPGGTAFRRELPSVPSRAPTPEHVEILRQALEFVGVTADIRVSPDHDYSVDT